MLKINVNKNPKEEENLFLIETHIIMSKDLERIKDLYINRIYFIFYNVLLFFIPIYISLKNEEPKNANINLFFDYYYEIFDKRKLELKFERNYYGIMIYKSLYNNLNLFHSFYSSQLAYKHYSIEYIYHFFLKDYYQNENTPYIFFYLENVIFYKNSSLVSYIYYKPNYLHNMNISIITNEIKLAYFVKALFKKVILEKYILYLITLNMLQFLNGAKIGFGKNMVKRQDMYLMGLI